MKFQIIFFASKFLCLLIPIIFISSCFIITPTNIAPETKTTPTDTVADITYNSSVVVTATQNATGSSSYGLTMQFLNSQTGKNVNVGDFKIDELEFIGDPDANYRSDNLPSTQKKIGAMFSKGSVEVSAQGSDDFHAFTQTVQFPPKLDVILPRPSLENTKTQDKGISLVWYTLDNPSDKLLEINYTITNSQTNEKAYQTEYVRDYNGRFTIAAEVLSQYPAKSKVEITFARRNTMLIENDANPVLFIAQSKVQRQVILE